MDNDLPKTYKLGPAFFVGMRKRMFFIAMPMMLLVFIWTLYLAQRLMGFDICGMAGLFMLSLIIILFGGWTGDKQARKNWASYQIELEPDAICRTQMNYPTIRIIKGEITSIKESPGGGIILRAGGPNRQIIIPPTLVNYSGLRSLLGEWHEIEVSKFRNTPLLIVLMFAGSALILVALGIFILNDDPVIVTTIGVILALFQIITFVSIRRSSIYDDKLKRMLWLNLIMVIFIILRIYFMMIHVNPLREILAPLGIF